MSEIGQKFIAEVRNVAASNPDLVYVAPGPEPGPVEGNDCVNVYAGQPSCIIGHGAWNLGLIDASFEHANENAGGLYALTKFCQVVLDANEARWLAWVQGSQDAGHSWAQSVLYADEWIEQAFSELS